MAEALAIATVSLENGGRLGICRMPGLSGDLASDVRAIVDWKPRIVVSMTEQAEMNRYGGGNLATLLADASIEWRHLPIRDYGEPQGASRDAWPKLAAHLHKVLDEGRAVLLHCRGGQGRSGMIALRLLVERGEDASGALARLRSARPHAVETDAQMTWASAGSANPWKRT
jgi:protein-tyrosine phosphatase